MIEVFKALGLTLIFGGVVIAILTITALKKITVAEAAFFIA